MKRLLIIGLLVIFSGAYLRAQESDTLRTIEVEGLVVKAARSLREIGVQKTPLSAEVLSDNVSASLADVLAKNSTIFIKSSGRATLATASLRGTAPSHTVVRWNGIDVSSPMLGMVDFSMIPSYFVDGGDVYHGATSVGVSGGGLGGAVVLSTSNKVQEGFDFQYVQNLASYSTHDEFLRVGWGNKRLSSSTRVLYSSSDNDFEYINRDKYGHPTERNKNCGYNDFHLLQELFYNSDKGDKWSVKAWYTDSNRGIPRMTVDFRDDDLTKSWQEENSFRSVAEWKRAFGGLRLSSRVGYNHNTIHYIYQFSTGGGATTRGVDSSSESNHTFSETGAELSIGNTLMLAASLKGSYYGVDSKDIAPFTPTGYTASRLELSSFASARWKPTEWFGAAVNVREDWYDGRPSPLVPALFVEALVWPQVGLIVSGSLARNYRYPTLNDLYYVPGGNPDLLPEEGRTFDVGAESSVESERVTASAKVTYYHSDINNWILWTPTIKGFWTPQNLQRVVSNGFEMKANVSVDLANDLCGEWRTILGYTSSVNATEGSNSYGNQLPYIPHWSASSAISLSWRRWSAAYQWQAYSDRQTTYSGTSFSGDVVDGYSLSDISLGRSFECKNKVVFKVTFEVNNLFNAEYQSVLSRPMPPRNYGVCLEFELQ